MNRDKALAYRQRCLDESLRQREMVETIPQNKLLLVTYRNYFHNETPPWKNMKVACEVKLFNLTSVRCLIYAAERISYPFRSDFDFPSLPNQGGYTRPPIGLAVHKIASKDLQPLKFYQIVDWELLPKEHLPLIISFDLKYPRFDELLKG
jgi:hypothetical protein